MKHLIMGLVLGAMLGASASEARAETKADKRAFGSAITLKEAKPLSAAAQASDPNAGGEVLVDGEIKQVCQKKGCWMTISEGGTEMRVTFKDYGFFVPKDLAGKKVRAQGQFQEKEESVKDQKHYLKDAGASAEEIAAVKAPKKVKSFVASGVEIL